MFGRIKKDIVLSIVLLFLVLSNVSVYHLLRSDFGTGDDGSYISHVSSFSLDYDKNYLNEIAKRRTVDGLYPSHSFGGAITTYPLTVIGASLDKLIQSDIVLNRNATQFSFTLLFLLLSKVFMFYAIIWMLGNCYQKFIGKSLENINLILAFVLFGAGSYYFFQRFTMVHAEEIFLTTLIISISTLAVHSKNIYLYLPMVTCSVMIGLLTKASNIPIIFIPIIVGYIFKVRVYSILGLLISGLAGGALAELIKYFFYGTYPISPRYLFGRSISEVRGLPESFWEKVLFLLQNWASYLRVMFSFEYGLIFTNPIVGFAILYSAYFLLLRRPTMNSIPYFIFLLCAGFSVSIVVFWQSNGTDYGYRYLLYLTPLAVVMLAHAGVKIKKLWGPVIFSVCSSLVYKGNSLLAPGPGLNSYSRYEIMQNSDYVLDVFNSLFDIHVWLLTLGKGFYGAASVFLPDDIVKILADMGGTEYAVLVESFQTNPFLYCVFCLIIITFTVYLHLFTLNVRKLTID